MCYACKQLSVKGDKNLAGKMRNNFKSYHLYK